MTFYPTRPSNMNMGAFYPSRPRFNSPANGGDYAGKAGNPTSPDPRKGAGGRPGNLLKIVAATAVLGAGWYYIYTAPYRAVEAETPIPKSTSKTDLRNHA
ncbi:hypothetical protein YB2330_001591 [Saitoella coloradoensis]